MNNNSSLVRKEIQDFSNPLNVREFNRQMNWIWRKLLGGLDDAAFSGNGMQKVAESVEKITSNHITVDKIDTNVLNAALAKFMVSIIGICDANYLTAVDGSIRNLLVREGSADSFSFRNLLVKNAQILRATIGDLCVKSAEGDYYILSVDSDGKITTTKVSPSSEQEESGFYNGKQIVETTIVAEDISTDTLSASLILADKLDAFRINAECLTAREAFITSLVAQEAFIQKLNANLIQGNEYINLIVGNATVWRVEVESSNPGILLDDASTTLSARVYQGAIERTGEIAAACFRWRRSGDDPDADAIWNAAHRGVKSVVISGGDVRYNAVYSCDVLDTVELLTSDGDILLDANNDTLTVLEVY